MKYIHIFIKCISNKISNILDVIISIQYKFIHKTLLISSLNDIIIVIF